MAEVTPDELVGRVEQIVEWSRHLSSSERATLRAAVQELRDHCPPPAETPKDHCG